MEKTMQPQEATKEPMVELDTGGNAVDIELKAEKEVQVEEQKDDKVEQPKEVVKEVKKANLFVAIKGKNKDGHNFLNQAIRKGASFCIVSKTRNKI